MASKSLKNVNLLKLDVPERLLSMRSSVELKEGFNTVDGNRVFYREALLAGEGNALSEITLVLLHGLRFSSKTWLDLGTLHVVAAMGYRALAIDLPGFGESPAASISDRSEFLRKALEVFAVTKPVIVSPSMSGFFTLPFLLQHWEVLSGYIPVAPVGIEILEKRPSSQDTTVIEGVCDLLKPFLQDPLPNLSYIMTPTMVVYGERDRSRSSALLSLLPDSQSQEIPNAGHPAYLDDPDLWHKLLYNFLQHLASTTK